MLCNLHSNKRYDPFLFIMFCMPSFDSMERAWKVGDLYRCFIIARRLDDIAGRVRTGRLLLRLLQASAPAGPGVAIALAGGAMDRFFKRRKDILKSGSATMDHLPAIFPDRGGDHVVGKGFARPAAGADEL